MLSSDLNELFMGPEILVVHSSAVRGIKKSGAGDTGHDDAYQNDFAFFEPIAR
jgi:hypothetical protein